MENIFQVVAKEKDPRFKYEHMSVILDGDNNYCGDFLKYKDTVQIVIDFSDIQRCLVIINELKKQVLMTGQAEGDVSLLIWNDVFLPLGDCAFKDANACSDFYLGALGVTNLNVSEFKILTDNQSDGIDIYNMDTIANGTICSEPDAISGVRYDNDSFTLSFEKNIAIFEAAPKKIELFEIFVERIFQCDTGDFFANQGVQRYLPRPR